MSVEIIDVAPSVWGYIAFASAPLVLVLTILLFKVNPGGAAAIGVLGVVFLLVFGINLTIAIPLAETVNQTNQAVEKAYGVEFIEYYRGFDYPEVSFPLLISGMDGAQTGRYTKTDNDTRIKLEIISGDKFIPLEEVPEFTKPALDTAV